MRKDEEKSNVIPFPGLAASKARHPAGRLRRTTEDNQAAPPKSHQNSDNSSRGTEKESTVMAWGGLSLTFYSDVLRETALRQTPICTHSICWISFLGWALNIQLHFTLALPLITTQTWSSDRCMNLLLPEYIQAGEQLLGDLGLANITFSSDPPNGSA